METSATTPCFRQGMVSNLCKRISTEFQTGLLKCNQSIVAIVLNSLHSAGKSMIRLQPNFRLKMEVIPYFTQS